MCRSGKPFVPLLNEPHVWRLTTRGVRLQASGLPPAVDKAWESIGGGPADLIFPEFFLGRWGIVSTLIKVDVPLGPDFVPDIAVRPTPLQCLCTRTTRRGSWADEHNFVRLLGRGSSPARGPRSAVGISMPLCAQLTRAACDRPPLQHGVAAGCLHGQGGCAFRRGSMGHRQPKRLGAASAR